MTQEQTNLTLEYVIFFEVNGAAFYRAFIQMKRET